MKHPRLVAASTVLGVFTAAMLMAQVVTAPPLSGNFALSISGFELVSVTTPSPTSLHLDIQGEGLVTADGNGNLAGNGNLTAANPAVPENGPVSAQCAGALTGTVAEPGDGTAQIQLQFTPSTSPPPPTGVGAQDACVPMTMALSCVEVLPNSYPPPVAVASGTTGSGTTADKKRRQGPKGGSPKGGAAKGGGPGGPGGAGTSIACPPNATCVPPIACPPCYFPSGADKLTCVATSVTTSSTAASIDGALLNLELHQTAPASIVLPTPVPYPSPSPTAVPVCPPGQSVCGD